MLKSLIQKSKCTTSGCTYFSTKPCIYSRITSLFRKLRTCTQTDIPTYIFYYYQRLIKDSISFFFSAQNENFAKIWLSLEKLSKTDYLCRTGTICFTKNSFLLLKNVQHSYWFELHMHKWVTIYLSLWTVYNFRSCVTPSVSANCKSSKAYLFKTWKWFKRTHCKLEISQLT